MDYRDLLPFVPLAIIIFNLCVFVHRLVNSKLRNHALDIFINSIVCSIMASYIDDISVILQISVYIISIIMIIFLIYSLLKNDTTK